MKYQDEKVNQIIEELKAQPLKSVLIAIQPYYVFLIIAHLMGWNIPENKTVEVRKDCPKDPTWDKVAHIYCSKNRKSFNRIPAKYQPLMAKFLGKVVGKFVCDSIRKGGADNLIQAYYHNNPDETCLTDKELVLYANIGKPLYFWHISNLMVYETPKELCEFKTVLSDRDIRCKYISKPYNPYGRQVTHCILQNCYCEFKRLAEQTDCIGYEPIKETKPLDCPPQSWCYVEG